MRGYKINVAMAEKSAPKAAPTYGHGYLLSPCSFCDLMPCVVHQWCFICTHHSSHLSVFMYAYASIPMCVHHVFITIT